MPTETYSEPTGYAATAAELRRIVEALESLPPGTDRPYLSLTLLLGKDAANEVDTLGDALFGLPGAVQRSGEAWYHVARSYEPRLSLTVQSEVPGPPDERDAELERLRAELAEARAAAANSEAFLGTNGAVAEAKPDTLGIAMGRAAVPELKPWESNAPLADRIAESMEPIDPDSSMEAHYDAEMEAGARTQPDMQTRPQCPPECRQNWTRASDPLAHVAHCPNASPPAGA